MTRKNLRSALLSVSAVFTLLSCQSPQLDAIGETYLDLPADRYQYNAIGDSTNAVSTLGRVLFYDRQMSLNNSISCASCHKQSAGFADNQQFSRGFEGRLTTRNSMPVQNLVSFSGVFDVMPNSPSFGFGTHFFWDGREQNLQNLVLQPVGNHIEMGISDINALTQKLSALPYYSTLFQDAFGSAEITSDRISIAISTFASAINTNNTKFDLYNRSRFDPDFVAALSQPVFNSLETEGFLLFQDKYDCNSCHQVQSPNGYQMAGTFANIGLDNEYADVGLQNVTGKVEDAGKFKIPSLRNVAFTAPYMHDGRFKTLEDVIGHYSEGLANHPNLDPKLKDESGNARSMNITAHERDAIIAFLHTLSDESVITDPKFSNPFKVK